MPSTATSLLVLRILVAGYAMYLGIDAVRSIPRNLPHDADARTRGWRAGLIARALVFFGGGAGVLGGWAPASWLLIFSFAFIARREFLDYATGFAEGMKSVELAASMEYVHGRIKPKTGHFLAAAAFIGITRGAPIAILLADQLWTLAPAG